MTHKDAPIVEDKSTSVEYVPVPAWNSAQPQTANIILDSLGGAYGKDERVAEGDVVRPQEGWVPPSNRDGETEKEDRLLGKHKQALMQQLDSTLAGEIGTFTHQVDPRENPNAPDESVEDSVSKVAVVAKK